MSEQFKNKLFKDLILKRSKSVEIDLNDFPLLSNLKQKEKLDLNKLIYNSKIPKNFKKKENLDSNNSNNV